VFVINIFLISDKIKMSDPICQLMEDIDGLCKRCYHLQKSNNDMYGKSIDSSNNMYIIC
jgi:hypothetical protein